MKTKAKILICYNSPVSIFPIYNGKPADEKSDSKDLSEHSFASNMMEIENHLRTFFSDVSSLAVDRDVNRTIQEITKYNPDAILNFVESVEGIAHYEYCMAGLYELLEYEYTGNVPQTLGNCLNKKRTKEILYSNGIKTPRAITLAPNQKFTRKDINLNYPLILKLIDEDASIGISENSVVNNYRELRKHFTFLTETYNKKLIVEEYIVGRELNCAVLGGKTLPISEIDFTGLPENLPKIVTYDGKWIEGSTYYNYTKPVCPANIEESKEKQIKEIAVDAYNVLGCRDYARVDIRLSDDGIPYVIEVNPNPDVSSDSGFARAAAASGKNYSELLFTITNFALQRKYDDPKNKAV
ncbi:MAG TPA: ATP-grasp domain-containing protein [Ignavibacteriaceae bacterium]|jgi:D-alanine-D-alanine ligase|nr:MAG: D-alanine--D-alanine ligase [Ignavibacteria bacterium ADurb.Bin266]OQY74764.1 MAG: D-alanine--D-alanine ligase [Ignavibacteriales bacterium UTCHB2]HQF43023.1 ATP-grasp domain-containing protein [Ignavibacteriaceae bacterium]HQI40482.1 ATP-grasp domain-containing protein [Ignavibacteriaceae bacterium]HQJ45061.1 ATP-grasp domain-containing protein [Ignavibacteriaceae bacterium]